MKPGWSTPEKLAGSTGPGEPAHTADLAVVAAVAPITPLALLMTQIGMPHPVPELLASRAVETLIGALVGLGVLLVGFREDRRGHSAHPGDQL